MTRPGRVGWLKMCSKETRDAMAQTIRERRRAGIKTPLPGRTPPVTDEEWQRITS